MQKTREKFAKIYVGVGSPVDLAMEKGISQGETRKAASTARAMLADSLPIATIVRYTGLTADEVEALRQEG